MNMELKNPCLECDHHISGGDKNDDICRNCDWRVAYVNAIDPCPCSSVSEHVDLCGNGGSTVSVAVKDPVENYIRQVCSAAGVSEQHIRGGFRRIKDQKVVAKLSDVRDTIIIGLASGKFGNLDQEEIGGYLGVSSHVVSKNMRKMGIAPGRGRRSKHGRPKPKKTKRIKSPPEKQPTSKDGPPRNKNISDFTPTDQIMTRAQAVTDTPKFSKTMTLEFAEHPHIYDELEIMAQEELRTIENQALYLLIKLQERGMDIPER